jgi:hypothetical protein
MFPLCLQPRKLVYHGPPPLVIGHGILAGSYLDKCHDSPSSQSLMQATRSEGDRKDMPITLYPLLYVERSDPSTRAMIHQLLKVTCWNQCRHMRMYVFGLIMTSFLMDRVCRLSYSLQTIQLTPSENTHALRDHVEFYINTTSSSSVETSFK